jgi:hypothetical protein
LIAEGGLPGTTERARKDEAARRVLNRDRRCAKWYGYLHGLDPFETYRDLREREIEGERQRFERALAKFQGEISKREQRLNVRLTVTAITVGFVIGVVQLWAAAMSMAPDAIGIGFGRWVLSATTWVEHLLHIT